MELIDKDAVMAEINRLYQEHSSREYTDEGGIVLDKLEDFIDTLEVKEVDIDEAARKWEDKVYLEKGRQDEYGTPHVPFSEIGNAFMEGAKFILKAQKGE